YGAMAEFQVVSDFRPMGDQPQAIEKLVQGIKEGYKHQTLLGVTGSGKSLGYHDPVFIVERRGNEETPRVTSIGPLIDSLIEAAPGNLRYEGDTTLLDVDNQVVEYYAQAFNPNTCVVELYPIQTFTRHTAPQTMYRIKTACGRSATLTGDHNLWALRNGQLQLIRTDDARSTDYVPVPETLLGEGN